MKQKAGSFASLVLMAVLGVVLILFPSQSSDLIIKIIGVGLLLYGAVGIIGTILSKSFSPSSTAGLVGDICAVVIGLVCLFNAGGVKSLFHIFLGAIIIVHGISLLLSSLDMRALNFNWQVALALSIISIVMGLLILLNIFSVVNFTFRVAGIVLFYNAMLGLWFTLKK